MKTTREQECDKLLAWLQENLNFTTSIPFRREYIAETVGISASNLAKALAVLKIRGYIELDQRRNEASRYLLLKEFTNLSGEIIDKWIKEHQRELDRKVDRKAKKALYEEKTTQMSGNAAESTLFRSEATAKPALVSQYRSETETPVEPASIDTLKRSEPIDLPLTPTQQRLKLMQEQLEQLQKEVEEEAKQQTETSSAPGTSDELFTLLDNRIDSIEGKVNVMLTFFEQATAALRGLSTLDSPKSGTEPEPPAEPTTRTLLVRLVNSFAAAERRTEHETWKYLYGQFDLRTGLNAYAVAPNKTWDQSYLTVIEERGQIDALYDLAKKLLVLPALK